LNIAYALKSPGTKGTFARGGTLLTCPKYRGGIYIFVRNG